MEGKKYMLKSSDGEEFEVDEVVAMQSQLITHLIEDDCANDKIPLPNVNGETLSKVIEYCRKHVEMLKQMEVEDKQKAAVVEDELKDWDTKFVDIEQSVLFDIILAANYLDIKSLLDMSCQKVADMIMGKSPEELRKTFNIKNDFTPEEEEEIRREHQWAFN